MAEANSAEETLDPSVYERCPKSVYIEASNDRPRSNRKYIGFLRKNGIETKIATRISLWFSGFIGSTYIGIILIGVLAVSWCIGYSFGCQDGSQYGCERSTYEETRTIYGDESTQSASWPRSPAQYLQPQDPQTRTPMSPAEAQRRVWNQSSTAKVGGAQTSEVERTQLKGSPFSLPAFQASIIVFAFILAFTRWMIENRQSSMSELFERKKEVNLLLLKDDKGVFQPLVSDALKPAPTRRAQPEIRRDCEELLKRAAIKPPAAEQEPPAPSGLVKALAGFFCEKSVDGGQAAAEGNPEFLRKMFVYIELDNFELAFNRYMAGLLDPEQMYRAYEIMQSRCSNRTFRYLAAVQGLKYYTEDFHSALLPILIRTEFLDRGEATT